MRHGDYLRAKVQLPAAIQETEMARTGQNASIFPSANLHERSLLGVSGNLDNLRPKTNRRSSVQRQRQRTLVPLVSYLT